MEIGILKIQDRLGIYYVFNLSFAQHGLLLQR